MKEFLEIIEDIQFENVDELFVKKAYIKENLWKYDLNVRTIYKWYFFWKMSFIKNPLKELFWSYISRKDSSKDILLDLSLQYRIFCQKRDKMIAEQQQGDEIESNLTP